MDLSIIIPAYNEERRIALTVRAAQDFLRTRRWEAELVVVDDGSLDDTGVRVRELIAAADSGGEAAPISVRYVRNDANRGKGYSVRLGVRMAQGGVIGFMDADLKTDMCGLDGAMALLQEGYHGVIGDRTARDTCIQTRRRPYREVGSRVFRGLLGLCMGMHDYPDTQCGFKFFQGDVARELFAAQFVDGFMFDVEILVLASRRGYAIARIPVIWRDDPDSRFRPISGSLRNVRDLLRIRWRHGPGHRLRTPP